MPRTKDSLPVLVVVGHGMVAHRFCETLSQLGGLERYQVVVLGEEPVPAYDRVHLGELLHAGADADLSLTNAEWYAERGIELALGDPVTRIDRASRQVFTRTGRAQAYDLLVLATGARARVPDIEGLDASCALTYRNLADVERIRQASQQARTAVVLGGGLLGLECADGLRARGIDVSVLEASKSLLPRQLDSESAQALEAALTQRGIRVQTGYQLLRVTEHAGGYALHGESRSPLRCDLLVLATGVVPEDTLAREAGLTCAARGGVAVSDTLATSDEAIFAIGDCASHRGLLPGLVAPGYDMADVLAARLCGDEQRVFLGAGRDCRLKLAGVEVAALGRYDMEAKVHRYRAGNVARTLVVHNGRLVGATFVGDCPQIAHVQRCIQTESAVSAGALRAFARKGLLPATGTRLPVANWPQDSLVCQCARVSRGQLCAALQAGAETVEDLKLRTRAGSVCGSCTPLLGELLGKDVPAPPARFSRLTGLASGLAMLALVTTIAAPSVKAASSVQGAYHVVDQLFRSSLFRQLTGFGILAALTLGSLLSARKRIPWFRWGEFTSFRALHTCLGVAALVLVCVHTGLRLGVHLNLALMLTFVTASLLGAVAGVASYFEARGGHRARRLRGALTRVHLWALWPLPALLFFHILSAYYF